MTLTKRDSAYFCTATADSLGIDESGLSDEEYSDLMRIYSVTEQRKFDKRGRIRIPSSCVGIRKIVLKPEGEFFTLFFS